MGSGPRRLASQAQRSSSDQGHSCKRGLAATAECATARQELGVYLLGTIDPAARLVVDRHLATCTRCREELASLAGLPALLQRTPVAEAALFGSGRDNSAGSPPEQLLVGLLSRAARLRRWRRRRLSGAAAALITATATAWGLQAAMPATACHPALTAHPWSATASGFNPATGTGVTVRYSPRTGGTQLQVHVTGIPVGTTCQFWVASASGRTIPAGAWAILPGQRHRWYPASVPVPAVSLRSFVFTSGGKVLAAIPARRSSTPPRA